MANGGAENGDGWTGLENEIQDLEEIRVLFTALDSFSQYAKVTHFNVTHLRRQSFYALPQAQWQLLAAPPFNYLDTLDRADEAIESNAELARLIVKFGLPSFHMVEQGSAAAEVEFPHQWVGVAKHADVDKARSTIRQFYRDWSAAGAREREICYGPVMRALEAERRRADPGEPASLKVLVPGAGLGRLVFELSLSGHLAEGNEISYHQLLASSYVLNCCQRAEQHTIYPWVHSFSNHLTREHHLRSYKVPDIHPAEVLANTPDKRGTMEMYAADFLCLYSDEDHAGVYDAVASVFFLDTAPNVLRYLETIFYCLKPGGVLINLGPLLWHFENNAPGNHGQDDDEEHDPKSSSGIADPGSFELTDEEVRALVSKVGFEIESWETGIDAPYIQDTESMLLSSYRVSFWVARKPLNRPHMGG